MNKLILCEGETDAILLSYYLGKIAGWKYCEKAPKNIDIKKHNDNESVNWYKKGKDYLLICGVGGKDNFGRFFETRIKAPLRRIDEQIKNVQWEKYEVLKECFNSLEDI